MGIPHLPSPHTHLSSRGGAGRCAGFAEAPGGNHPSACDLGVIAGCVLFLVAVRRALTTGVPLQRLRLPVYAIACMAAGAGALMIDAFLV